MYVHQNPALQLVKLRWATVHRTTMIWETTINRSWKIQNFIHSYVVSKETRKDAPDIWRDIDYNFITRTLFLSLCWIHFHFVEFIFLRYTRYRCNYPPLKVTLAVNHSFPLSLSLSPYNFAVNSKTEVLYSWRLIDQDAVVLRTLRKDDRGVPYEIRLRVQQKTFGAPRTLADCTLEISNRSLLRISLYLSSVPGNTDCNFLVQILWKILRIFWTVIFLNVLFQQLYCNGKILSSPTANFHFALLKIFQWMRFDILIFSLLLNSDCSIRTCDDKTGVRS